MEKCTIGTKTTASAIMLLLCEALSVAGRMEYLGLATQALDATASPEERAAWQQGQDWMQSQSQNACIAAPHSRATCAGSSNHSELAPGASPALLATYLVTAEMMESSPAAAAAAAASPANGEPLGSQTAQPGSVIELLGLQQACSPAPCNAQNLCTCCTGDVNPTCYDPKIYACKNNVLVGGQGGEPTGKCPTAGTPSPSPAPTPSPPAGGGGCSPAPCNAQSLCTCCTGDVNPTCYDPKVFLCKNNVLVGGQGGEPTGKCPTGSPSPSPPPTVKLPPSPPPVQTPGKSPPPPPPPSVPTPTPPVTPPASPPPLGSCVPPSPIPAGPAQPGTILWQDGFDGNGVGYAGLSCQNWVFMNGDGSNYGIPGWGNAESEIYQSQNVEVKNGNLYITAKRDMGYYSSGKIKTQGLRYFNPRMGKNGVRVEGRMQLPLGQGLWPAFWLLPNYPWYGGWPHSGEIDIVEHKNLDQTVVTTLHFSKLDGTYAYITSTSTLPDPQNWHTYAVEWKPASISWFVDGKQVLTVNCNQWSTADVTDYPKKDACGAPFDVDFYIILNMAVGGRFIDPSDPNNINPDIFPAQMVVDYVKVSAM